MTNEIFFIIWCLTGFISMLVVCLIHGEIFVKDILMMFIGAIGGFLTLAIFIFIWVAETNFLHQIIWQRKKKGE